MDDSDNSTNRKLHELRSERGKLHPDRTNGKFQSDEDEQRYHEIEIEIRELESESQAADNHLVPISQLPALIEALSKSLAPATHSSKELEREYGESSRLALSRKYSMPKIGSGIAATVVAFLFTQSKELAEHPFLGPLVASDVGQAALGYSFFLALCGLGVSWLREQRELRRIKYLLSKPAAANAWRRLSAMHAGCRIEEQELQELLLESARSSGRVSLLFGGVLEEDVVENIFEVQLQRLLERKLLKEVTAKQGVYRVFEVQ